MKKTIIFAIALVSALCACTKQDELIPADQSSAKQIITAYVNAGTKVGYTDNNPGISSVWEAGDTFKAIQTQDGETSVVTFTLTSGAGTTSAVFTAETTGATEGTKWIGILGSAATVDGTAVTCSYMNQTGKLADFDDFAYVKAEAAGLKPVFDFNAGIKLSYILRIKLPAGIKSIEYTPCGYEKVTASATETILFNNDLDKSEFTSDKVTTILNLDAASAAGDCLYITVPAIDYSKERSKVNNGHQFQNLQTGVVLTLMNDVSDNATLSYGTVFDGDARNKGGMIKTLDFSGVTLLARPRPSDAVTLTATNVKYADSAMKQAAATVTTYWAPFNIGASKPSEQGWFMSYATHYQNPEGKFTVCNTIRGNADGTQRYLSLGYLHSKYAENSDNNTYYTISKTKYDGARVIWGRAWRIPHTIELAALLKGDITGETVDGNSCVKIALGGNFIYLPLTGFWKEGEYKDAEYAEIWGGDKQQRSWNSSNSGRWNEAWGGHYKAGSGSKCDSYEHKCAMGVRPVLASSVVSQ